MSEWVMNVSEKGGSNRQNTLQNYEEKEISPEEYSPFQNPIVKHTFDSLPRIYGNGRARQRERGHYSYLDRNYSAFSKRRLFSVPKVLKEREASEVSKHPEDLTQHTRTQQRKPMTGERMCEFCRIIEERKHPKEKKPNNSNFPNIANDRNSHRVQTENIIKEAVFLPKNQISPKTFKKNDEARSNHQERHFDNLSTPHSQKNQLKFSKMPVNKLYCFNCQRDLEGLDFTAAKSKRAMEKPSNSLKNKKNTFNFSPFKREIQFEGKVKNGRTLNKSKPKLKNVAIQLDSESDEEVQLKEQVLEAHLVRAVQTDQQLVEHLKVSEKSVNTEQNCFPSRKQSSPKHRRYQYLENSANQNTSESDVRISPHRKKKQEGNLTQKVKKSRARHQKPQNNSTKTGQNINIFQNPKTSNETEEEFALQDVEKYKDLSFLSKIEQSFEEVEKYLKKHTKEELESLSECNNVDQSNRSSLEASKVSISLGQVNKNKVIKYKLLNENGSFKIPSEGQYLEFLKVYGPLSEDFSLSSLFRSTKFSIVNQKESLYFGEVDYKNRRHGKGVNITKKQIFQGLFQDGTQFSGTQRNIDGIYAGSFHNGKRHGFGRFLWNNGEIYEGNWEQGMKNGEGSWRSPKGASYKGEWVQNRQTGKGIFKDGKGCYEGEFWNFLRHGKGKQVFSNGDQYIGMYEKGKPSGKGEYIWKDKTFYTGDFAQGLREGYGVWHQISGSVYSGQFTRDLKHGQGNQTQSNGVVFIGLFENGQRRTGNIQKDIQSN